MTLPQVSIIIINFNTFELTCKCIESVMLHTKKLNYEIILLDNASTETEPDHFKTRFPTIQLIKSKTNLGFAKGNNTAIKLASAEVILLLNSDTELVEDSVFVCYTELMKYKKTGAIGCKLFYPDGKVQNSCQSFPSFFKFAFEKIRLHKLVTKRFRSRYLQGFYWNYEETGSPDWIWGTFFMFRRELIHYLPQQQLNEDYFMYVEDMKWCFDIRQLGYNIQYTPKTRLLHHQGGSSANVTELVSKNQIHFVNTHYSKLNAILIKYFIF